MTGQSHSYKEIQGKISPKNWKKWLNDAIKKAGPNWIITTLWTTSWTFQLNGHKPKNNPGSYISVHPTTFTYLIVFYVHLSMYSCINWLNLGCDMSIINRQKCEAFFLAQQQSGKGALKWVASLLAWQQRPWGEFK